MRLCRSWCAELQLDDVGTGLVTLEVRSEDSLVHNNGSRRWAWRTTWAAAWEKARQAGVVAAVDNVTGRYEWPCKTSGHVHGDG